LKEVNRVLKKDGVFYIGTPNKDRAIGYLGSNNATFYQKISWNCHDFKKRIQGRFENEYGAHAGFSKEELYDYLKLHFDVVVDVTKQYYKLKYGSKINIIEKLKVERYLYPSIYFLCK
jgi:hypothetical protein